MTKIELRTVFLPNPGTTILSFCIAVVLSSALTLVPSSYAADGARNAVDVEDDAVKTFHEKVYEFIDSIETLDEDIRNLDLSVVRIALYRLGMKRGEVDIPANVASIIESKLKSKLLETRRLQVYECIECKIIHVSLQKDKLVMSKAIESNERLKELGKKIGVDGFLIWGLYKDEKNLYLDLSIVNAQSGMVAWSNQYIRNPILKKTEPEPTYNVDLSLSFLGYTVARKLTAGGEVKVERILAENIAIMKKTAISERISVGLGLSFFHNITDRDLINISGLYIYPLLEIQLGPYYESGQSLLNFYVGAGEAFGNKKERAVLLTGVNIRMRRELFASVGFISMNKKALEMPTAAEYEPTVEFGGPAYELKFGYRF